VSNTDNEAPHYEVFFHSPVTSSLLGPNILLIALLHALYNLQN
jgi:hypothetical protein